MLSTRLGHPNSRKVTSTHDALISTLKSMRPVSGRKALILISSGVETFSKAKYADALNSARESGTPIYVIGLEPGSA